MSSKSKKKFSYIPGNNSKGKTNGSASSVSKTVAKNENRNIATDSALTNDPIYQKACKFRSLTPISEQDFLDLMQREEKYNSICKLLQGKNLDDFIEAIKLACSFIEYRDCGNLLSNASDVMLSSMRITANEESTAQLKKKEAGLEANYQRKLEETKEELEANYQNKLSEQKASLEATHKKEIKALESKHQKTIDDFVHAQEVLLETKDRLINGYKNDYNKYRLKAETYEKKVLELQSEVNDYKQQIDKLPAKQNSDKTGESFNILPVNGQGRCLFDDGSIYVGDYKDGKMTGRGTRIWPNGGSYTGQMVDGKMTGKGAYSWADGRYYSGDFVEGIITGKGSLIWPNGESYSGYFINGNKEGKGILSKSNGEVHYGLFVKGNILGPGYHFFPNGSMVYGQFGDNSYMGKGFMLKSSNGKQPDEVYCGEFDKGKFDGEGIYVFNDGTIRKGTWKNDKKDGISYLISKDNTVTKQTWKDGKRK